MIEVRIAGESELPVVHEITLKAFEEFRDKLDPPTGALYETIDEVRALAVTGGAILAFLDGVPTGSARYALNGDHLYCGRLGVLPEARGQGLGGEMLSFLHALARERGLSEVRLATREVMESNLRFYARNGYEITSSEPHQKGGGIVVHLTRKL